MRKPEFQKIRRIRTALLSEVPLGVPKSSGILVQLVCLAVGCPGESGVFHSYYDGSTYNGTHKLVERDNSLPGPCWPLSHHSVERGVVFGSDLRLKGG
jgi:hypothetical protein